MDLHHNGIVFVRANIYGEQAYTRTQVDMETSAASSGRTFRI